MYSRNSLDPAVISAFNQSLIICIKNGDVASALTLLPDGEKTEFASGILDNDRCIFEIAAQYQQPEIMKLLAERLTTRAAFNPDEDCAKNLWLMRLLNNKKTLPYVEIYLHHAARLYSTLSSDLGSSRIRTLLRNVLTEATKRNHYKIVRLILSKNLINDTTTGLVRAAEMETADALFNIAVEETKNPQMIALYKKYNIGLNRAAHIIEPDAKNPVELALALSQREFPVFFIISQYFWHKLALDPDFNKDLITRFHIFTKLMHRALKTSDGLVIENDIQAFYDKTTFPATPGFPSTFKKTVSALLAYTGNEIRQSALVYVQYLKQTAERTPLQVAQLGLIFLKNNTLFQLHYLIYRQQQTEMSAAKKAQAGVFSAVPSLFKPNPEDEPKSQRWLTDFCNVVAALSDKDNIDLDEFALIIKAANTAPIPLSMGYLSRSRVGEFHDQLAKLLTLSEEERLQQYGEYKKFIDQHQLDPMIDQTIHDKLQHYTADTLIKSLKKLG